MSARIVFFGNERLATGVTTTAPVLQALIDGGYDVRAVISHNEDSRTRKPRPLEIAAVAASHNIPLLLPPKLTPLIDELRSYEAEIGVLVAYGKIVPQAIIDIFPKGIVNIHPSALPAHRGPTPLESVMLAGNTDTAVSLMALAAAMDAGPIYAQQPVSLTGRETKQQLADQLLGTGRNLVVSHLPSILNGTLEPEPQNDDLASYDRLITKADGILDWQQPAAVLERSVRAFAGWPRSRADIGGQAVIVTAAHAIGGSDTPGIIWLNGTEIGMQTSDGILVIDRLIPAGKKEMSGSDFLLGYRPS